MKLKSITLVVLIVIGLIIPYNKKLIFLSDKNGVIRITRIDRGSIVMDYGTFLTPGKYMNRISKPKTYVNPYYIGDNLDIGCFEFYVEFEENRVILYNGGYCEYQNLTNEFYLRQPVNGTGQTSWYSISQDTTGKYGYFDCNTGI